MIWLEFEAVPYENKLLLSFITKNMSMLDIIYTLCLSLRELLLNGNRCLVAERFTLLNSYNLHCPILNN